MRTEEAGPASDQGCRRNFLNDGRMTFRAFLWHDLRGTFFWWSLRHKSVRRLRRFIAKKSSHKRHKKHKTRHGTQRHHLFKPLVPFRGDVCLRNLWTVKLPP